MLHCMCSLWSTSNSCTDLHITTEFSDCREDSISQAGRHLLNETVGFFSGTLEDFRFPAAACGAFSCATSQTDCWTPDNLPFILPSGLTTPRPPDTHMHTNTPFLFPLQPDFSAFSPSCQLADSATCPASVLWFNYSDELRFRDVCQLNIWCTYMVESYERHDFFFHWKQQKREYS